jgi:EmrB/QacA subfamily drug resistance transporter
MVNRVRPSQRPYVVGAIMLATCIGAIEGTIVATAVPTIVAQLGGFSDYSWVFSAFLLAQTTTSVIYGKLADLFGRKPTLIAGIVLFLIGSSLCGWAGSMSGLIAFRLVQGLGAGAIYPITATLIGDLYKLEERGMAQGLLAAVWAISAVLGPLVGSVIVEHGSWAWIFWINLPIGGLTIVSLALFLHEEVEPRRARIDYAGAALFAVSVGSLLLFLTETAMGVGLRTTLSVVSVATGVGFWLNERRAPEPILTTDLWARRIIASSNLAILLAGMAVVGLTTVLPIYVQGVLGSSPEIAGLTLTSLVVGWPLAIMLSGRLYRAFGVARTLRFGGMLFPLGATVLLAMTPQTRPATAAIGTFVMGCGVGVLSITSIALVQDSVEWSMRGSATASYIFARSLGYTLGATAVGALLNIGLAHFGGATLAAGVHSLLNEPTGLTLLSANPTLRSVFDQALRWSFRGVVVLALAAVVVSWLIPVDSAEVAATRTDAPPRDPEMPHTPAAPSAR